MKLWLLLRGELAKVFGQKGTYVGYGVLAVLVCFVVWFMWRHGPPFARSMTRSDDFIVAGKMVSWVSVARFIMEPALLVLVPLLVATVSGGLFAGEMQRGTMRTLLCRPVRRLSVATAKYLAGWVHAISLTAFLGLFGLGLGLVVLGRGELITMRGGLTVLTEQMALLRLGEAYLMAALGMCAMASLATIFSQLVQNPLTAMALAVGFLLVSATVGAIPHFEWLKPYLLSTQMDDYTALFHSQVEFVELSWPLGCMAVYAVVPFVLGIIIFRYRDITC